MLSDRTTPVKPNKKWFHIDEFILIWSASVPFIEEFGAVEDAKMGFDFYVEAHLILLPCGP